MSRGPVSRKQRLKKQKRENAERFKTVRVMDPTLFILLNFATGEKERGEYPADMKAHRTARAKGNDYYPGYCSSPLP